MLIRQKAIEVCIHDEDLRVDGSVRWEGFKQEMVSLILRLQGAHSELELNLSPNAAHRLSEELLRLLSKFERERH